MRYTRENVTLTHKNHCPGQSPAVTFLELIFISPSCYRYQISHHTSAQLSPLTKQTNPYSHIATGRTGSPPPARSVWPWLLLQAGLQPHSLPQPDRHSVRAGRGKGNSTGSADAAFGCNNSAFKAASTQISGSHLCLL